MVGIAAMGFELAGVSERQRDLLPLPEVSMHWSPPPVGERGRVVGRLGGRHAPRRVLRWMREGTRGLNEFAGASAGPGLPRPNTSTSAALVYLYKGYQKVPWDGDLDNDSVARSVLQGASAGYTEAAAGALASYQLGCISLPAGQAGRVTIESLGPPDLQIV